ncbi:hypothetical protein [uncultured Bacteroides sp.]|uniref:hypothetical protein n=1 Tax=uncultured Bacteroides sp. TaxID=162156 RepID=UPI00280AFDD7|nr:hypothetical protein [uncultured Bacteroides sp.]
MTAKVENKIEKRKRISKEDAHSVLNEYYVDLFNAYYEAIDRYNTEIRQTIPEARTRLNSVLLNAKLTESFILKFPENWNKGKYGRIVFRWEGIQMLIKKLNENSKPSYIPTLLSDAIINQLQTSLFDDNDAKEEPVLIFGYTKNRDGQLIHPRIVYYAGEVEWVIDQDYIVTHPTYGDNTPIEEIEVRLKGERDIKAK